MLLGLLPGCPAATGYSELARCPRRLKSLNGTRITSMMQLATSVVSTTTGRPIAEAGASSEEEGVTRWSQGPGGDSTDSGFLRFEFYDGSVVVLDADEVRRDTRKVRGVSVHGWLSRIAQVCSPVLLPTLCV